MPSSAGVGTHAPPAIITSLPVRIDPEEEKRLLTLRSKIQKAEILREQAEQEYVAYRAHYVGQQHCLVQQTVDSKAVLQWLQALRQRRRPYQRVRNDTQRPRSSTAEPCLRPAALVLVVVCCLW
jgi:hypothetical protein